MAWVENSRRVSSRPIAAQLCDLLERNVLEDRYRVEAIELEPIPLGGAGRLTAKCFGVIRRGR
jgi:hypothetical protein